MLKSPREMEKNKLWHRKDNHCNDLGNMGQIDSLNFKGKTKAKGPFIILLTKSL